VDRTEAIAEAVAPGFQSYVRLIQRGKDPAEFPSSLATFAVLFVRNGRHVGGRMNIKDVLSPVAQKQRGFTVEPLQTLGSYEDPVWQEALIDNTRAPVPDQAAFRVDFPEFRRTLTPRDREILDALAMGDSGKDVAERFGLTPPRITQLRKQWEQEWETFIADFHRAKSPHTAALAGAAFPAEVWGPV